MTDFNHTWRAMPGKSVPSSLRPGALFFWHFSQHRRLLDLGCGRGSVLGLLARKGFNRLMGIDLNPAALAEAAANLPPRSKAHLICGDLTRLPLAGGVVDGVLIMAVLTILPDEAARQMALAEAARVLAPGGRLYLADFAVNQDLPLYAERYEQGRRLGLEPGQFPVTGPDDGTLFLAKHFTDDELDRLLAEAGFRVLEHDRPRVRTRTGNAVRGQVVCAEKQ